MNKNLPLNIAKPLELVYDNKNNFIGFKMIKIEGEEFRRLSSKKFVFSNNITKQDITKMLIQIKDTIIKLHQLGMCIGDLNDMNILFDIKYSIYFIDIDSWSVDDDFRCTVANDLFKDPQLINNYFTPETDNYAFAILLYKSLTRLHPFAGVIKSNPNISTLERMEKGQSVFSVKDLAIPPMVDKDVFLSTNLKDDLKKIFINNNRNLIDGSLDDFHLKLILCNQHNDYYYSRFNKCPVCELDAKEITKLIKVGVVGGIPLYLYFSHPKVKYIFNENTYLNLKNHVVFRNANIKIPFKRGEKYYSNNKGNVIYTIGKERISIKTEDQRIEVPKLFNSRVVIKENAVFFISKGLKLMKLGLINSNNTYEEAITRVSINNIFEIIDDAIYFTCNSYDIKKIIEISGFNFEIENSDRIMEYGIHYDEISRRWLFIFENQKGDFYTYIFDKQKGLIYTNDLVRYLGKLNNLCFYNNIIFKPADKKIIGFDYQNNRYKEFDVPIVNEETNLIKRGKKFLAINEKKIYEIG